MFYDQLRPGTGEWNIRRLAVDLPFHRDVAEATPSIINAKGNLSDGWLCYSISTDWENGAGWAIEAGDDDSPPCVASTYSPCFLSRSFDLRKLGADPNDAVLVDIDARFEVSTRFDCGGSIEVGVGTIPPILRGRRSLSPHTKVQLDFEPSNEWEWCDFKARGVCAPEGGVITFTLIAQDNQFWAGHYGPKLRGIEVHLSPSERNCRATISAQRPGAEPTLERINYENMVSPDSADRIYRFIQK